eukprot:scaffold11613_cov49-Phaeocystis_antarctica.AAC.3
MLQELRLVFEGEDYGTEGEARGLLPTTTEYHLCLHYLVSTTDISDDDYTSHYRLGARQPHPRLGTY